MIEMNPIILVVTIIYVLYDTVCLVFISFIVVRTMAIIIEIVISMYQTQISEIENQKYHVLTK